MLSYPTKQSGHSLPYRSLDKLQAFRFKVIPRMSLQLEFKQMPQAFTMTRLHTGDCRRKEVVVAHGALGFSKLKKSLLVLHFHSGCVVEQRIPVVEQRSRTSQSICPGIYEETKISKVSVGIGDDSIEDEHIFQRIHVLRPERFVVLDDSRHPTALHDIAHRDKRQFLTGEKLTLGQIFDFHLAIVYGIAVTPRASATCQA